MSTTASSNRSDSPETTRSTFEADQLQGMIRLRLGAGFDAYYVGLLFWGLASTVCGYLWYKSNYIPRALAAWGVISSVWCPMCTFVISDRRGLGQNTLWWETMIPL